MTLEEIRAIIEAFQLEEGADQNQARLKRGTSRRQKIKSESGRKNQGDRKKRVMRQPHEQSSVPEKCELDSDGAAGFTDRRQTSTSLYGLLDEKNVGKARRVSQDDTTTTSQESSTSSYELKDEYVHKRGVKNEDLSEDSSIEYKPPQTRKPFSNNTELHMEKIALDNKWKPKSSSKARKKQREKKEESSTATSSQRRNKIAQKDMRVEKTASRKQRSRSTNDVCERKTSKDDLGEEISAIDGSLICYKPVLASGDFKTKDLPMEKKVASVNQKSKKKNTTGNGSSRPRRRLSLLLDEKIEAKVRRQRGSTEW